MSVLSAELSALIWKYMYRLRIGYVLLAFLGPTFFGCGKVTKPEVACVASYTLPIIHLTVSSQNPMPQNLVFRNSHGLETALNEECVTQPFVNLIKVNATRTEAKLQFQLDTLDDQSPIADEIELQVSSRASCGGAETPGPVFANVKIKWSVSDSGCGPHVGSGEATAQFP